MSNNVTLPADLAAALARAGERYHNAAQQLEVASRVYTNAKQEFDAADRDVRELGRAVALLRAQTAPTDLAATIQAAVSAALGAKPSVIPGMQSPTSTTQPTATAPTLSAEAIATAGGDPATLEVLRQMAANPGQPITGVHQ